MTKILNSSGTMVLGIAKASERPKIYGTGRVCAEYECNTILNQYNADDFCNPHRKNRRRRIRGKTEEERAKRQPKCQSCAARARRVRERNARQSDGPWQMMPLEILVEGIVHREGHDGAATLCETW